MSDIEEYLNTSHLFDKHEPNANGRAPSNLKATHRGQTEASGGVNFDTFKKTFFPHLCHAVNADENVADADGERMETIFSNGNGENSKQVQ